MPFTKVGKDDYTSPSGRHFNGAQVRLYHANGDKFPGEKTVSKTTNTSRPAQYAQGGAVLGTESKFLKAAGTGPDAFRTDKGVEQDYAGGKPKGKDKSLSPVKPR
jgi:hypothetical protein